MNINQDISAEREAAAPANAGGERWKEFHGELLAKAKEIASLLPNTVPSEKFMNAAIIAVRKTPELLLCERRSLHIAVTAAAVDGLLPDGREGVILHGNEKVKVNGQDTWVDRARWQPMAWGIRKRARKLDDIIIDTAVVFQNDFFDFEKGDQPFIKHKPAPLGTAGGAKIGVYAIFRKGDAILHREVMDAAQVASVRNASKQPGGMMWTKFEEEGWRKSALRRGSKSVPCSEKLQTVIQRWDDNFDFNSQPAVNVTPLKTALPPVQNRAEAPAPPPPSAQPMNSLPPVATKREPAQVQQPAATKPPVQQRAPAAPAQKDESAQYGSHGDRALLKKIADELSKAMTVHAVDQVWGCYERDFEGQGRVFMNAAEAAYERALERVKKEKAA